MPWMAVLGLERPPRAVFGGLKGKRGGREGGGGNPDGQVCEKSC